MDLIITDPTQKIIYSAEREQEGRFAFSSELAGEYQFCFSNRMSTVTSKTVSLTLLVGDAPRKSGPTVLEPLEAELHQLYQAVDEVKNGQVGRSQTGAIQGSLNFAEGRR